MQDDVFDFEPAVSGQDYEQISYGKAAYKRVQRLRKKGRRRGIQVPQLGYELTKPEKPRPAFSIVAIVSTVLLVGIIIGIGFLYNLLIKTFTIFDGMGDVLKAIFDPTVFMLSAGLSAIPGLMIFLAYVLLIVMFLLPIGAVIYFYRFVRDAFYLAKCSKEEFAKGELVSSRITRLAIAIIVATVILIVICMTTSSSTAKLLSGLIYGGIVLALGGLLALMVVEKRNCGKWFEDLDESKKENYLAHEKGLRHVKRRLRSEKQFWESLGK